MADLDAYCIPLSGVRRPTTLVNIGPIVYFTKIVFDTLRSPCIDYLNK